uniref:Nephrin n=1 Tax=Cacopsylla melanoneura TaxID=428564 RepID=A0A8D9ARV4_9HEMI
MLRITTAWSVLLLYGVAQAAHVVQQGPLGSVEAVLRGTAKIPCNITEASAVALVIWYKENIETPIYSVDMRGSKQGNHWISEKTFETRRVYFNFDSSELIIDAILESDEGKYQCRVDYKHLPTTYNTWILTVIVPPERVIVYNALGQSLVPGQLPPVPEGADVVLSCVAIGGRPKPSTQWYIDSIRAQSSEGVLRMERLRRGSLHSNVTCSASNTILAPPVYSNFTVNLYLPPTSVKIVNLHSDSTMAEGKLHRVECQAQGSYPSAVLSWYLNQELLKPSDLQVVFTNSSLTSNTLKFIPTRAHSGKLLTCKGSNPHIPSSMRDDSWALNVVYKPTVEIKLGRNLNASNLNEGVDIYFDCHIHANPPFKKIIWTHNGITISNNASAGRIITNQTLVLQSVSRHSGGLYVCSAINSQGEGGSPPFDLNIKYEPVCKPSQQRVYGALRNEQVLVSCAVDANPPAQFFTWAFNNSAMPQRPLTSFSIQGGSTSVARYTPISELDYGTLLCWARNEQGNQRSPCIFHVVVAGKPDPLDNCSVTERSSSLMIISCDNSHWNSGGLPPLFMAEIYKNEILVRNESSATPLWKVQGLISGAEYVAKLYATNGKGAGHAVLMKTNTEVTSLMNKHIQDTSRQFPLLWLIIAAIVGLSIFVLSISGLLLFLRGRGGAKSPPTVKREEFPMSGMQDKMQTVSITSEEERNPDIIANTSDINSYSVLASEVGYSLPSEGGQLWGEESSHMIHHSANIPPPASLECVMPWPPWLGPPGEQQLMLVVPSSVRSHAETQTFAPGAPSLPPGHKESTV